MQRCPTLRSALTTALRAFRRGLRSAFTVQAVLYSFGIWLVAVLFWSGVTTASWGWLRDWFGNFTSYAWLQEVIFYAIVILLFAALVFVTVMLLTDFFLIQIIRKKVRPHYHRANQLEDATSMLSWAYIKNTLQPLLGFLLVPLVFWLPVVGAVILFVLLSYLNVRSFTNDALDGIYPPTAIKTLVKRNQYALALLGCMLAGFAFIPFAHILLPWLLGSSVCHLAYDLLEQDTSSAIPENTATTNNLDPN